MRNCVVLGSGRSGTSMVAGTLAASGYYLGPGLLPATESNPKGYFESREVNLINEALLASVVPPARRSRLRSRLSRVLPVAATKGFGESQRWLADISPERRPKPPTPELERRMWGCVGQRPFCLKDPRFSYTIDCWSPFEETNPAVVVVFRDPASTAESIVADARRTEYLQDLRVGVRLAMKSWLSNYQHVLAHPQSATWLFVHFEQVLYGDGIDRIARKLGAPLADTFRDDSYHRSRSSRRAPADAQRIYDRLCELADHRTGVISAGAT